MGIDIVDPFRKEYRELTNVEKAQVEEVKSNAFNLFLHLQTGVDPRCMATARTKLEEAVMWAVKGITA